MKWRPSSVSLVAMTLAVALVSNLATNTVEVKKDWWPTVVWAAVGVLIAATLVMEYLRQRGPVGMGAQEFGSLVDQLAVVVRKQWRDEVARRALNDPYPLPVRWEPAPAEHVARWSDVTTLAEHGVGWARNDSAAWAPSRAALAGERGQLVEVWRKVPTGRLVVLGDPGAGKTMLLARLVIDLLDPAVRAAGDPVAVLVSLASWHPAEQDLVTWLTEQLAIDHPALGRNHSPGVPLSRALLDHGLVLPVLDGLDEVPAESRALAVTGINQALDAARPLVVSCRTEAYLDVASPLVGVGVVVTGAAGVSISPLDADDVLAYLRSSSGGTANGARWDAVGQAMKQDTPLARVLVTPLMTTLARTVYNPAPGAGAAGLPDPLELLGLADEAAVEQHLLDGLVTASYRPHPSRVTRWHPEQAARWLAYLAFHLENNRGGSPDLAWWQLPSHSTPGRRIGRLTTAAVALVVATLAGLAASTLYGLAYSSGFGSVMGSAVGVIALLVFCTVHWLTGSFSAALASIVAVAIGAGLAADLGGDLAYLVQLGTGTSPALLVTLGLAAGFAFLERPVRTAPLLAGAVVGVSMELASIALNFMGSRTAADMGTAIEEAGAAGLAAMMVVSLSAQARPLRTVVREWALATAAVLVLMIVVLLLIGAGVHAWTVPARTGLSVGLIAAVTVSVVRLGWFGADRRRRLQLSLIMFLVLGGAMAVSSPTSVLTICATVVLAVWVVVCGWVSRGATAGGPAEARSTQAVLGSPLASGLLFGLLHSAYFTPDFGLAVGVSVWLAAEIATRYRVAPTPAQGLRVTVRGVTVGSILAVAIALLLVARHDPRDALLLGLAIGGAAVVVYGVDVPKGIKPVRSPGQVLAKDRMVFLVSGGLIAVAVAIAIGFVAGYGRQFEPDIALVGGFTYGLATGAVVAMSRTSWLQYSAHRAGLAMTRKVPWRLARFLRDAHVVHGLLRQNGASYQFRHVELQRRLAISYTTIRQATRSS